MVFESLIHATGNKVAAAAVAAGLLVSACSGNESHAQLSPPPTISSTEITVQSPEACIHPSDTELQTAETLLLAPHDSRMIDRFAGGMADYSYISLIQQKADQEGLTVYNGDELHGQLQQDLLTNRADRYDFDHYYEPVRAFLRQLGVSLEIGRLNTHYEYGGRAPTTEELESESGKLLMVDTLQAFSYQPKELIAISGLKHIIVVTGTETEEVAGYAEIAGPHDTMVLDITKAQSPVINQQGIRHELAHLIDASQCGAEGMADDREYTTLNRGQNIYYGPGGSPTHLSYEGYITSQEHQRKLHDEIDAINKDDQTVVCAVVTQERTATNDIPTVSDYHPNVMEDKAEMGANITDGQNFAFFADKRFSILYPKLRLLFARLLHQNPHVARYLAATSAPLARLAEETRC